jgi:AcrR family transcriptional regulator
MNKTKRLIFESAIKVFSVNGYNGATMDEIALSAGVAKGTLYYHFVSKEEIFKFTITEGMNVVKEEIEAETSVEENPIDRLKTFCRVQLNLVYRHKDFFKVVMSQLWGQELRQFELREVILDYIKYLDKFIQPSKDGGYIKNWDSSFIAYTLFGTICSSAVYELMNKNNENTDDLVNQLMDYILSGMGEKQRA